MGGDVFRGGGRFRSHSADSLGTRTRILDRFADRILLPDESEKRDPRRIRYLSRLQSTGRTRAVKT